MDERSYHGAMMNARPKYPNGRLRMDCSLEYKEGHRDARHECADIANGADAEIAALKAENERLRAALGFVADHSTESSIVDRVDRALLGEGGEG